MADKIRDDPKSFERLNAALAQLGKTQGKVGWFESAKYESGRPVAEVAAGNEFGIAARSIPPRPFMRPAGSENRAKWAEYAEGLANRVLAGKMTAEEAMEALTMVAEGDVAKAIKAVVSPPLSPITLGARKYREQGKQVTGATIGEIAAKLKAGTLDVSGVSDKPLVDSSHMINTLTHTVETKP